MARSRRSLTFPPASEESKRQHGNQCALCLGQHTQLSTPQTWKSVQAQQVALRLHIEQYSPVCRLCRDDITRLVSNPEHVPRWEKQTGK